MLLPLLVLFNIAAARLLLRCRCPQCEASEKLPATRLPTAGRRVNLRKGGNPTGHISRGREVGPVNVLCMTVRGVVPAVEAVRESEGVSRAEHRPHRPRHIVETVGKVIAFSDVVLVCSIPAGMRARYVLDVPGLRQ